MIKINWVSFFRHRVIFGIYLTRKLNPHDLRHEGPWHFKWKWKWGEHRGGIVRLCGGSFPWHRCWVWKHHG